MYSVLGTMRLRRPGIVVPLLQVKEMVVVSLTAVVRLLVPVRRLLLLSALLALAPADLSLLAFLLPCRRLLTLVQALLGPEALVPGPGTVPVVVIPARVARLEVQATMG
jgi:hypothetical protein